MAELRAEAKQLSESTGSIGRARGASLATSPQQLLSVTIVTEFVRWNEEAMTRCTLLFSQVELIFLLPITILLLCICVQLLKILYPKLFNCVIFFYLILLS